MSSIIRTREPSNESTRNLYTDTLSRRKRIETDKKEDKPKIKLEFEDERERGNSKPPAPEQASDGGVVEMVSRERVTVPVLENREELKKTMIHQWEATKTRIRRVRYRKNILLEYKEAWNKGELYTPHGIMIPVNRDNFFIFSSLKLI